MTMTTCSECQGQLSNSALICPHCGMPKTHALPVYVTQVVTGIGVGRQIVGGLILVVLVLFVGYALVAGGVAWDHIWFAIIAGLLTLMWITPG